MDFIHNPSGDSLPDKQSVPECYHCSRVASYRCRECRRSCCHYHSRLVKRDGAMAKTYCLDHAKGGEQLDKPGRRL